MVAIFMKFTYRANDADIIIQLTESSTQFRRVVLSSIAIGIEW